MPQVRHRLRRWTVVPLAVAGAVAAAPVVSATTPPTPPVPSPTTATEGSPTAAIPADWVNHTDDTGVLSVLVPPTWTDTNTAVRTDDGRTYPFLQISTNLGQFNDSFRSNGIQLTAVDHTTDFTTTLDDFSVGTCGTDSTAPAPYNAGDVTGMIIRRDCGEGVYYTELVANTPLAPNLTVVVHIGLDSDSDPAWMDLLMQAWTVSPDGAGGPVSTPPGSTPASSAPGPIGQDPTGPDATAPGETDSFAAETYFADLYSADPARHEAALALAAPGSPAEAYTIFQQQFGLALRGADITPLPQQVSETADGLQVCNDTGDCQLLGDIEVTDGLIANFSVGGNRIDERLAVPGDPQQFGAVTVELLVAYQTVSGGNLSVFLEITSTAGERFDFTTATFTATDGRVYLVSPSQSVDIGTEWIKGPTLIYLDFDGAATTGELQFSFTTVDGETVPVTITLETFAPPAP